MLPDSRAKAALRSARHHPESLDPEEFRATARAIKREISRVIVGQSEAIQGGLICLIAGGHALLEGVPGVGKTTLARALSATLGLTHSRIQFTPDLMPADITGTIVLMERAPGSPRLEFQRGPVFAGLVLADEINRASPRTQSALLEAMQEGTVTVGNSSHRLPRPFCVLATQNPVEMHGTYPLPEAQLDRFLLKLGFDYPTEDELLEIIASEGGPAAVESIDQVADGERLLQMSDLARSVPAARHVLSYLTRVLLSLQPTRAEAPDIVRRYVRLGPSPRGGQSLAIAARIAALLDGRHNVSLQDVRAMAPMALRHRIALSFDAERQGVGADGILAEVLDGVPEEER
jgi:MoxR-like ATPase